jgi:hypothetical protein
MSGFMLSMIPAEAIRGARQALFELFRQGRLTPEDRRHGGHAKLVPPSLP